MEIQKIEYLRKNGRKPKRDDDGNIIVKGNGAGRTKKGVLWCGINPANTSSVMLGFSLCSSLDKFDHVNGIHEPGFGLDLAIARAEKWANYSGYFVQTSWTEDDIEDGEDLFKYENPNPREIVEVPPSIIKPFKKFIQRCKRYYQDKEFPEWIEAIESNKPVSDLDMIEYGEVFNDEDIFIANKV